MKKKRGSRVGGGGNKWAENPNGKIQLNSIFFQAITLDPDLFFPGSSSPSWGSGSLPKTYIVHFKQLSAHVCTIFHGKTYHILQKVVFKLTPRTSPVRLFLPSMGTNGCATQLLCPPMDALGLGNWVSGRMTEQRRP